MSETTPTTILSSTTIHGALLVIGLVFYGLFALEGLADLAGEQPTGYWLLATAGSGWLILILGYFRPFHELVLASIVAVPTGCWFLLSDDGQASLLQIEYLAFLFATMLIMLLLMARLHARRQLDEKYRESEDALEDSRSTREVDDSMLKTARFPAADNSVRFDVVPGLLIAAIVIWCVVPFALAGRAVWNAGDIDQTAALVALLGGVTGASVALYLTVLDPMRYVRDIPARWSWKHGLYSLGLLILAAASVLGSWLTLSGGAS